MRLPAALVALALLSACSDDGPALTGPACQVVRVAEYPLHVEQSLLYVPVTLDGTSVLMLLDTGAEKSVLTKAIVTKLDMTRDSRNGTVLSGVGGQGKEEQDAIVGHLVFAGHDLRVGHLPVVELPFSPETSVPFAGILGADMLSHFDLDLDVAKQQLGVYRVHNCAGRFLPWSQPYETVGLETTWADRLLLPVTLDGVVLQAFLDTGAASSIVDTAAAARLGVTEAVLAKEPHGRGIGAAGPNVVRTYHQFSRLQIGADQFANPGLTVLDRTLRGADMLLGEDFLRLRRVWISYRTRQLFVARPAA